MARKSQPIDEDPAPPFLSFAPKKALAGLEMAAQVCTRCPLYANATQAVCGAGPASAPLMLVGEQPGDQEDLQGRPFVGPAGRILDAALEEAGIDRGKVYVTNAVKHFRFTEPLTVIGVAFVLISYLASLLLRALERRLVH